MEDNNLRELLEHTDTYSVYAPHILPTSAVITEPKHENIFWKIFPHVCDLIYKYELFNKRQYMIYFSP